MSDHESIPLFFARPWGVGRRARDRMPAGGRTHVTGVHGVVAHVVVHTNTTSMVLPRHSTHTFCDATKTRVLVNCIANDARNHQFSRPDVYFLLTVW